MYLRGFHSRDVAYRYIQEKTPHDYFDRNNKDFWQKKITIALCIIKSLTRLGRGELLCNILKAIHDRPMLLYMVLN